MADIINKVLKKAAARQIPAAAILELTPQCNFHCGMCYVRQAEEELRAQAGIRSEIPSADRRKNDEEIRAQVSIRSELPPADRRKDDEELRAQAGIRPAAFWEDTVRQGMDAGLFYVVLTGGEPLLYPDFAELYRSLAGMGVKLQINSNGSRITPDIVRLLKEFPPVLVSVTLYGASDAAYGRFCGDPQGFGKVRRGVDLLAETGIRFRLCCSLSPANAADLEEMTAFAKSFGQTLRVTTYLIPPVRRTGQAGDFAGRFTPREAGYYAVYADYLQMTPERFLQKAEKLCAFCTQPEEIAADTGEPGRIRCGAGRSTAWIDWQGRMGGCGLMAEPRYSLDTHTFAEGWEKLAAWTRALQTSAACAACPNRKGCPSCAAAILAETGTYDRRPVYLCEMRREAAAQYAAFAEKARARLSADVT